MRRKGEQVGADRRSIVPFDQILANINLELNGYEETFDPGETTPSVPRQMPRNIEPLPDFNAPSKLQLQKSPINDKDTSSPSTKPRFDVPTELDDIKETLFKLRHLCDVIELGRSIGRFSSLRFAARPGLNAERSVLAQTDQFARKIYLRWKYTVYNPRNGFGVGPNGEGYKGDVFNLPRMNWRDNVAPVPTGPNIRAKFAHLAEAVDVVFGYRGATLENAMWLKTHNTGTFVLAGIVRKILFLERHRRLNQAPVMPGLDRDEAADVQTIRRVVAQANANMSRELTNYLQALHRDPEEAGETAYLEDLLRRVNEVNKCLTFLKDHATQLENKCMQDYHFRHQPKNAYKRSTESIEEGFV
ncbi:hypothetical protein BDW69DRAFT_173964 [Aspergillus filifer]